MNLPNPTYHLSMLAGGANVIMQLSLPQVGYGVIESRVESGNIFKHPYKRTRTTMTNLAVAMFGTESEVAIFRNELLSIHRQVYSTAQSPVAYHAYNPSQQLWVAACLYFGSEDTAKIFYPHLTSAQLDDLYEHYGRRLCATVQIKPQQWPVTRQEFYEYWHEGLTKISIDETMRDYLLSVARLRFFPWYIRWWAGGAMYFLTMGFLPPIFRDELGVTWTSRQQQRFNRVISGLRVVNRLSPPVAREFPLNLAMWDFRRRVRAGKPVL